ncbi:MAG TPA: GFA family protein [Acetobacteraceae bacterium]|jgi:hypothetical protein|nr:GFA family protein [Acetobacteraceae bacterium]
MAQRTPTLTGGCQCGAVRYALYADPRAGICHCRMCQKAVGGPFFAWAMVGVEDFAWTRGAPTWFRSSSAARRGFCAACGTPLAFQYDQYDGRADHIDISIGSLDTPEVVRPVVALGIESRLPWCDASLFDALPAHPTGSLNPPTDLSKIENFQHRGPSRKG